MWRGICAWALLAGCEPAVAATDGGLDARLDASPAPDVGGGTDVATPDSPGSDASGSDASGSDAPTPTRTAGDWIREHLAGTNDVTGDFDTRTAVETPALVHDATGCCAKYAFDVREEEAPDDRRVGFVDVTITDLVSTDAFGGGISAGYAPGLTLFLANVVVEPRWPEWVDYATTNYDGLVLDDAAAIYAEDLTVRDWNADGAIDDKALVSQFVRLRIEGRGNRGIRFWAPGPHYLVDSHLENTGGLGEGTIFWFSDCDTVEVRIFASTFDGEPTIDPSRVSCDVGSDPNLVYLTTDPRTTGEMHEMFTP